MLSRSRSLIFALSLALLVVGAVAAHAAPAYDTPSVNVVQTTQSFIAVDITAGPSGAPAGFTVDWMKLSDYTANGGWPTDYSAPGYSWCTFDGTPTLNFTSGVTYNLGPNQTVRIVLGELFDETGVSTNYLDEMADGTQYIMRVHAEGDLNTLPSNFSGNVQLLSSTANNCTFTVGYWKNHGSGACQTGNNANAWPVAATPMLLGTVSYTAAELCSILNTPAGGNGLISLAHQLIAAKLNIAAGASSAAIASTVAAADAQIGGLVIPPVGGGFLSPGSTGSKTYALDQWNNGVTGPGHCGEVPTRPSTWGRLKTLYH
jgi:hypothetical protein